MHFNKFRTRFYGLVSFGEKSWVGHSPQDAGDRGPFDSRARKTRSTHTHNLKSLVGGAAKNQKIHTLIQISFEFINKKQNQSGSFTQHGIHAINTGNTLG